METTTEAAARRAEIIARQLLAGPPEPYAVRDTCGIVAYVGDKECFPMLLEGLKILENRGYDSAGIATVDRVGKELTVTKFASSTTTTSDSIARLGEAGQAHARHTSGIAHTRWATHGAKTDVNAHPHCDRLGRVAIVHNGVLQNYVELRNELEAAGIEMVSETDSEVIAQLIGKYIDEGLDVVEAARRTHGRLVGTWGVVVVSKLLPGKLIAMKNGSPLLVGLEGHNKFVASEAAAFARYTRNYVPMKDMEFAVLDCASSSACFDLSRVQQHADSAVALSPEPWPHWTIREIMEQPVALSAALNHGGRQLDDARVKLGGLEAKRGMLQTIRHLVIAACGTSLYAGMFGAALMRRLGALDTVQVVDAAELTVDIFPRSSSTGAYEGCGLLVISQSGETKDVHRAVALAAEHGIPQFSVVNVVGSLVARCTGCGLYINAGREVAVASTKAFTSQVCCLALIAVWFSQQRQAGGPDATTLNAMRLQRQQALISQLRRLPTDVGLALGVRKQCRAIAQRLVRNGCKNMFLLGKGTAEPVAREGALKVKEITYVHAEGYGGGALKHGPFALIEDGTPIIMITLDDSQAAYMDIAAAEVMTRGAYTIVITNNRAVVKHADEIIELPSCGSMSSSSSSSSSTSSDAAGAAGSAAAPEAPPTAGAPGSLLSALVAIVPIQLIAYEMSVARGINPDKPRNLAKAVTVD